MGLVNFIKKHWVKFLVGILSSTVAIADVGCSNLQKECTDLLALTESQNKLLKKCYNDNLKYNNLLREHINLLRKYNELREVGKTKVVNKTDCSSLELICFETTSKDVKNDFSNQQGLFFKHYKNKEGKVGLAYCNGVFITYDGFFLTNYHSYYDDGLGKDVRVFSVAIPATPTKPGDIVDLEIIAYSESSDLALFRVINEQDRTKDAELIKRLKEDFKLKNITLSRANSDLVFKYWVDNDKWGKDKKATPSLLTEAKIKKTERKFGHYKTEEVVFFDHYLETNEFVGKKGMSGAPLYDSSGNLVGIANAGTGDSSCFVPSDVIFSFLQDCIYYLKNK
ncbi:hypothetical protein DRJ25_02280 [Candidatus Woesearchaeota archaeon]|nr:MAG: hypothetical protein DRJ25_02280 [Candidatus Woesearchaeota archaeon]